MPFALVPLGGEVALHQRPRRRRRPRHHLTHQQHTKSVRGECNETFAFDPTTPTTEWRTVSTRPDLCGVRPRRFLTRRCGDDSSSRRCVRCRSRPCRSAARDCLSGLGIRHDDRVVGAGRRLGVGRARRTVGCCRFGGCALRLDRRQASRAKRRPIVAGRTCALCVVAHGLDQLAANPRPGPRDPPLGGASAAFTSPEKDYVASLL